MIKCPICGYDEDGMNGKTRCPYLVTWSGEPFDSIKRRLCKIVGIPEIFISIEKK